MQIMKSLKQFLCESYVMFGIDLDNLMKILHDNFDGKFSYDYNKNESVIDITKDDKFLFSIEKQNNETHFICPSGIRDVVIETMFNNEREKKINKTYQVYFDAL